MSEIMQRSFTSGEISPSLQSRADLTKYATGLNLCENFFVRAQGGVYSRPGFRFIGELDDSLKVGRLIPFSFNTEQTYILVFEHLKMRVIKDGGYVLAGGPTIFELATPYTEVQLSRLDYTQSADVMTIVHPEHDPANLNRLADNNWNLVDIDYSPAAVTLFPPGTYTIIGVTQANPAVVTTFNEITVNSGREVKITDIAGMVELNGRTFTITVLSPYTFELDGEDSTSHTQYVSGGVATLQDTITIANVGSGFGTNSKDYIYVITYVDVNGVESLASAEILLNSLSLTTTGGIRLTWPSIPEAVYYRVYKDPSVNTHMFGWIGDSNNTAFDDYNIAPITSDAPPSDRQPFTGVGNKPSAVTYYQQRQILANTTNEPQTTFTTQVNNYNSLRTSNPTRDDDAVTFTVAAQQVNEIRHLISLDSLIMLTSRGEWVVSEGQDRVLTPSTIGVRAQSFNGSSWVKPVVINSTALYLQEKNARVRDLTYEFSGNKYTGNDLSLMSEHLFENYQIIEMTYSDEPYGILWCVRDDGQLLGLTYQREHQVIGWHQHTTDGEFESVATISEDSRDALYAIVKRTINGQTKRYVERLEKREKKNASDAFYVDSGLTYDGTPATVISGLDHLEGKEVAVLADGYDAGNKTVTSGSITLSEPSSKVHVGLSYTPTIELLDIDSAASADALKSKSVSVSKVTIEVEDTRGGFVGPRQDPDSVQPVTLNEIKPRQEWDNYDQPSLLSYKQEVVIEPLWSKGGGVRIEQRSPLPMAILSVIPRVDISGS